MKPHVERFLSLIRNPVKFRAFLFSKLPAAFFTGINIVDIDQNRCSVSVPFKWLTQNPFRSTYFASLAMAAEMSTGALAMMHVYKRQPAISMLLVHMEASYGRKVTGKAIFTCEEGEKIHARVEEAILTDQPQAVTVKSTGKNSNGELVAEFHFTWSFKMKHR